MRMPERLRPMLGKRVSRVTVVERKGENPSDHLYFELDCGLTLEIYGNIFVSKNLGKTPPVSLPSDSVVTIVEN